MIRNIRNIRNIFIILSILLLSCIVYFIHNYNENYTNNTNNTNKNKDFYAYVHNFLSDEDFLTIKNECLSYNHLLSDGVENNYINRRKNIEIVSKCVQEILNKEIYREKLRRITNNPKIYLAHNFPIEYRKYEKDSFMRRHSDTLIYRIPQYECVYTLFNQSDTKTVFYDDNGKTIETIQSEPNSLMILRANGVEHEVLPVTYGERFFLKFIFTETDELL